jgi:hypothetical protein
MTYTTDQIQAIFDERISNIITELKHTDDAEDVESLEEQMYTLINFKTKFK